MYQMYLPIEKRTNIVIVCSCITDLESQVEHKKQTEPEKKTRLMCNTVNQFILIKNIGITLPLPIQTFCLPTQKLAKS